MEGRPDAQVQVEARWQVRQVGVGSIELRLEEMLQIPKARNTGILNSKYKRPKVQNIEYKMLNN